MPILGIMASAMSGNLFAPSGAYDSIATYSLSSLTATVTFSSIPATYKHLQLRLLLRTDRGGNITDQPRLKLNSDTGANYTYHDLVGNGATASASGASAASTGNFGVCTAADAIASVFGTTIVDILDYADTNKYTTIRSMSAFDNNGTGGFPGQVFLASVAWLNTAAVTTIAINAIGSYVQYSSFALYGIKGA